MAPPAPHSNNTHHFGGQSWESQLTCLFIILGFVLRYTLGCHLYTAGGWGSRGAVNSEAVDRTLGAPSPNQKPI
ncbi:hypothetical protein FB451DRAFT_1416002 [Mycena latifolia]|nr:hypothetical protein FB451DRAFT_1416002 [Mycena latifolia]